MVWEVGEQVPRSFMAHQDHMLIAYITRFEDNNPTKPRLNAWGLGTIILQIEVASGWHCKNARSSQPKICPQHTSAIYHIYPSGVPYIPFKYYLSLG